MVTVKNASRYGRIEKGDRIPYGTMANASQELRDAYYRGGYFYDADFPELPVWEPEPVETDLEYGVHQQDVARIVNEVLDTLTPREAKVLRLRWGINLPHDRTLEEVGRLFDVTRERVRQIEAKAMRKMRHPARVALIQPLFERKLPTFGHGLLVNW